MEAVQKKYLTPQEVAKEVGRCYASVVKWLDAGRIKALSRETAKQTRYRVHIDEVASVKEKIQTGEWF